MSQAELDADLLDSLWGAGMAQSAAVGSTEVTGFFFRKPIQIETENAGLIGLELSFHCRYSAVAEWVPGTEIEIDEETFKVKRHVPEGGDESGWVHLELGRKLL